MTAAEMDLNIEAVQECIERLRTYSPLTDGREWSGRVTASQITLAGPWIAQRDLVEKTMREMASRGLLRRVDEKFDAVVGERRYEVVA